MLCSRHCSDAVSIQVAVHRVPVLIGNVGVYNVVDKTDRKVCTNKYIHILCRVVVSAMRKNKSKGKIDCDK